MKKKIDITIQLFFLRIKVLSLKPKQHKAGLFHVKIPASITFDGEID